MSTDEGEGSGQLIEEAAEQPSYLPDHNSQYLDAKYWDERFQKVLPPAAPCCVLHYAALCYSTLLVSGNTMQSLREEFFLQC